MYTVYITKTYNICEASVAPQCVLNQGQFNAPMAGHVY